MVNFYYTDKGRRTNSFSGSGSISAHLFSQSIFIDKTNRLFLDKEDSILIILGSIPFPSERCREGGKYED
jgi:hypothetical protein